MKKVLTITLLLFISSAVISCRSSKKPKVGKLDEKTKKYWKWNSATGGEW